MTQPPLLRDQRKVDADHLKLLSVFHFVGAGLAVLGILFIFVHYAMFQAFFCQSRHVAEPKTEPTTRRVFGHIQVGLRGVCDLVCCLGHLECDVRNFHPLEETQNVLFGCFSDQLFAHAAGHCAGRVHDHSTRSRFRSGTV